MSSGAKPELVIYIDDKEYQPLRNFVGREQLLDLASLDPGRHEIFLIDSDARRHVIEGDEGLQLQTGMRFVTQSR